MSKFILQPSAVTGNPSKYTTETNLVHADEFLNDVNDVAPPIHVSTTFRYPRDPSKLVAAKDLPVRTPSEASVCDYILSQLTRSFEFHPDRRCEFSCLLPSLLAFHRTARGFTVFPPKRLRNSLLIRCRRLPRGISPPKPSSTLRQSLLPRLPWCRKHSQPFDGDETNTLGLSRRRSSTR